MSYLEGCDDGNLVAGDGCFNCLPEWGYTCSNTDGTSVTQKCLPICGDYWVVGSEVCDDGFPYDSKGCTADCKGFTPGWQCTVVSQHSVCFSVCGDGLKTVNEQCDDGNTNQTDGCYTNCTEAPGYSCVKDIYGKSVCTLSCGNGVRDTSDGEGCDDGNKKEKDGCSSSC